MSLEKRVELYKRIEAHRKRPLIVYVTSKRPGTYAVMSTEAIPYLIQQIDGLPAESKEIDLLIASFGGDPMVAWRISSLLRQRVGKVFVLIPQSAYSAATLLALGANEIVMHPNGHLGPVDFQISYRSGSQSGSFSTEDISAFLDFVRDNLKITDQEHIRALFEITCREVGSLVIGFTARSSKLAVEMGENLLQLHMNDEPQRAKIRTIVESMSRKFQSHAYPVNRTEALDIGLPVNKKPDSQLDQFMWDAWLLLEEELKEREPFDPICELLNSTEADKLMAPVPQLEVPLCATAGAHYNTTLNDIKTAVTNQVGPIDYEYTDAIVESSRIAFAHKEKGKILAHRLPDLQIAYNVLVKSRIWENLPVPTQGEERKTS
jgi:hypothetical protein